MEFKRKKHKPMSAANIAFRQFDYEGAERFCWDSLYAASSRGPGTTRACNRLHEVYKAEPNINPPRLPYLPQYSFPYLDQGTFAVIRDDNEFMRAFPWATPGAGNVMWISYG